MIASRSDPLRPPFWKGIALFLVALFVIVGAFLAYAEWSYYKLPDTGTEVIGEVLETGTFVARNRTGGVGLLVKLPDGSEEKVWSRDLGADLCKRGDKIELRYNGARYIVGRARCTGAIEGSND